ncbi:GNAT family N-acetyltransferase [Texcoconibacillus texcoconensis]|uniref:Putative acetyltransferase n=1 Tax=Texcoconibacillus texcoconensis TaxID=1095777 RepID=A0A840QTP4_9BACI|nr:GNAT family N-acetyltransferase [Texcoconibacillus texcoconensis]MBB5174683.1 putative acetyltransferase [Texcoconibacillus texcoconensis]
MNIRKSRADDKDVLIDLSEFAFQYELSDEDRNERREQMKPEWTWVVEEEGQVVSKTTVIPLVTYVGGKSFNMGGVSGVATWPEHRRSGFVRELLSKSLEEMRSNGQCLSFLYPFSIPLYRKYGWELFTEYETITLKRDQLPERKTFPGQIKRKSSVDSDIKTIYEQVAPRFHGTLKRDDEWWDRSVLKKKKGQIAAYYDDNDTIQGYIIYKVKDQHLTVHEWVSSHVEARNALFSFLANHDSMIDTLTINAPVKENLSFSLPDPKIKRDITSYFMARIVDVENFLQQYPFATQDKVTLIFHVRDPFCSWNEGTFIVKTGDIPGENDVQRAQSKSEGAACTHPPKRGIHTDIKYLTAMLMNAQSPLHLYDQQMINGNKKDIDTFSDVIPNNCPYLYDFF